ncbi:MAG TPA: glycosyltransferase [Devosiaceae bacterium]|jgi:cellulose synthase/poly-beta-1,6-N-acetylglucosamine synthase-like glycosyltransferase|nr:glycosyltransferase [Devosiaceae bacterium]
MGQPQELVRALLGGFCRSDAEADMILRAAERLGVDPLDYCVHRYPPGAEEITRRAAEWAGIAYSPVVPSTGGDRVDVTRLDQLAQARSMRETLFDREVTFIAPRFSQLVKLRQFVLRSPGFRRYTCIAPPAAIRAALAKVSAPQLMDDARQRLARRWPFANAGLDLGAFSRGIFLVTAAVLIVLAVLAPILLENVLLPLISIVLVLPALLKFAAVAEAAETPRVAPPLSDAELPIYSVLVPLYREAEMVPQLRRALSAMSYPPEKLDIKFVVEAKSPETVAAVEDVLGDARFELVVVPDVPPHTKPKALNYALPFVRGEYVVVFDAEDIPNPDQLRLAAASFEADPTVACLQAELLIDNARENLLTGLFAGEYAGQFGVLMPALAEWGFPMPLGGTSNHFRTSTLRELGGWDAFNVTEDADLGARLARLRLRTAMLFSQTYEEAPVRLDVWMRQRTRWMKGWMQTFIVHNRHPVALYRDMGPKAFFAFELYVGSIILSPFLHTAFFAGLLIHFVGRETPFAMEDPRSAVELFILLVGYGAAFAVTMSGLLRLGQRRLLLQQLLLPAYWILHTTASIRAGCELLTRPSFWAKTQHGMTRLERSFAAGDQAPASDIRALLRRASQAET